MASFAAYQPNPREFLNIFPFCPISESMPFDTPTTNTLYNFNLYLKMVIFQGEKIQTILKAANVEVEPYWPGLFAKALDGINIKDLITNVGSGVGAAPAGGAG
jgi:hypothetical protein